MLRRIGRELDDSLKEVDSLKEIPNDRSDSTRTKPYLQLEDCATNVTMTTYDVAVIGAGAFGAWSAQWLGRSRHKVLLLDQYGPANARASSGGESRIIRLGYGPDEIYTRMAQRSLELWLELFGRIPGGLHAALKSQDSDNDDGALFRRTEMLWLAAEGDDFTAASERTLAKLGGRAEHLSRADLQKRYPQIALDNVAWALLEADSGVLMARRAVAAVVRDAIGNGVE